MTELMMYLLAVLGCVGVAISITVKLLVVQCLQRQRMASEEGKG